MHISKSSEVASEADGEVALLRHYFHVDLKPAVAASLSAGEQVLFLANIDVAAAEAFFSSDPKLRREEMLKASTKYFLQLKDLSKDPLPESSHKWITSAAPQAVKQQHIPSESSTLAPKLLRFDESSGQLLNKQDVRVEQKEESKEFVSLPWRA